MRQKVLILCTSNSARSQMAEGFLRHDRGDQFDVQSAGTKPSLVRPEAIAVMREVGIDISGNRSKHVDEFASEKFDYVLTVCDNAEESVPYFRASPSAFIAISTIPPPSMRPKNSASLYSAACATRSGNI